MDSIGVECVYLTKLCKQINTEMPLKKLWLHYFKILIMKAHIRGDLTHSTFNPMSNAAKA